MVFTIYDQDFLNDLNALPQAIDPCGENGEFHTFVYAAPCFHKAIDIKVGEIVERDGFVFADILGVYLHF